MLKLWRALALGSGLPGLHIVVTVGRFYRVEEERRWYGSGLLDAALHFVAADRCCWEEAETRGSGGKGRGPAKRPVATGADAPFVEQPAQYWGAFTGFDRRTRGGKLRPQDVVTPLEFESALGASFAGAPSRTCTSSPPGTSGTSRTSWSPTTRTASSSWRP
ncbi:unnamed protein product [Prorocentrum cordatum]|uniref:Uncharacterized protein n=1 Tax=Prorocentrum cordatum TaxID=2364126 RepID=A0ABN9W8W5_9DINO|nr:unnamed protein product [Polarella glacialis]